VTGPLATLSTDKLLMDKVENVQCGPQHEVTLFNRTGPGVVKSLWMAVGGGNNPALDGRLRVYYDGAQTPTWDIDVATLFASHWGANGSHSTPHMHIEIQAGTTNTAFLLGFPIPFYSAGLRIAYYNPGTSQTAAVYSMATYTFTATDPANGMRLRCQGKRYMDQAQARQPGDVTTFATITGGPGSIVWHSYIGGVDAAAITPNSGNGRAWMERNVSIAVDGEASPSIVSTGTEDWFDSGWYFNDWRDYGTSVHSYVGTDRPQAQPNTVGMATDLWSKWGGVPFQNSAIMRAETEPACTTGDRYCYAVLYYQ
jgi:hypothetical protein